MNQMMMMQETMIHQKETKEMIRQMTVVMVEEMVVVAAKMGVSRPLLNANLRILLIVYQTT
jgi:transcriptional/translational regulatory protein YebC/TACO1